MYLFFLLRSGSQILKKFVINGPGPFWLQEPDFKEVCY